MKKVLSILAVAAVMLFAGEASAQVTIHAGYQSYNIQQDNPLGSYTYDNQDGGFYAGADYNIELNKQGLGVAPGVEFSYFKDMLDLRVPVLFNWKENFGAINCGVFAGPVLSIGVDGDLYKYGFNKTGVALDGGIWIGYKQLRLEGGYSYDLLDREDLDNVSVRFNKWFVGLAFIL